MNDQISNLTEQSFPEIRRNDRSLNESIWTPKCDKLHVFDMVEKMRRKKSLLVVCYLCTQAKINSFCMGKLLIKINIVQTQFWKKPIYMVLSRFRKKHVLFRLFSRIFFCGKRKPIKHLKIIHLAHHSHPCKRSYTCAIYYQFHK